MLTVLREVRKSKKEREEREMKLTTVRGLWGYGVFEVGSMVAEVIGHWPTLLFPIVDAPAFLDTGEISYGYPVFVVTRVGAGNNSVLCVFSPCGKLLPEDAEDDQNEGKVREWARKLVELYPKEFEGNRVRVCLLATSLEGARPSPLTTVSAWYDPQQFKAFAYGEISLGELEPYDIVEVSA
ncbi:MAG: hypothetical protein ABIJ36_03755 [Patescibacteria group bacterium]